MLPPTVTKSIPLRWLQLVIEIFQLLIKLQYLDNTDEYPSEQVF